MSDFSFLEAMHSWYEDRKETYQGPIPKIEYQTGKDVVAVGTFVATGGLATISKIKKGTDFVEGLVTTVKKNTKKVFKNADEFALAIEKVRNVLRDKIKNLPETRELALAFYTKSNINNMNFDKWFENVFKKYESGTFNFEAHHIIPINTLKKSDELKELLFNLSQKDPNFKFDFNSIDNGIMLQKKSLKPGKIIDGHANHPKYDLAIEKKIDEIIGKKTNIGKPEEAFNEILDLIKKTKETLKKEVFLGDKDVNDIFKK